MNILYIYKAIALNIVYVKVNEAAPIPLLISPEPNYHEQSVSQKSIPKLQIE